jgi:hypothetical protein
VLGKLFCITIGLGVNPGSVTSLLIPETLYGEFPVKVGAVKLSALKSSCVAMACKDNTNKTATAMLSIINGLFTLINITSNNHLSTIKK